MCATESLIFVPPHSSRAAPRRESKTVVTSARKHFSRVYADTVLADNGIENVRHGEIGVPSYFCDPGSPWQKPHVEGGIGLARRWFLPKSPDLAAVPDATFQSQLHLLNGKSTAGLSATEAPMKLRLRGVLLNAFLEFHYQRRLHFAREFTIGTICGNCFHIICVKYGGVFIS